MSLMMCTNQVIRNSVSEFHFVSQKTAFFFEKLQQIQHYRYCLSKDANVNLTDALREVVCHCISSNILVILYAINTLIEKMRQITIGEKVKNSFFYVLSVILFN